MRSLTECGLDDLAEEHQHKVSRLPKDQTPSAVLPSRPRKNTARLKPTKMNYNFQRRNFFLKLFNIHLKIIILVSYKCRKTYEFMKIRGE